MSFEKLNYYEILGVSKDAPLSDIQKSYHRLLRQYHPDVIGESGLQFTEYLNEIYATLSNESKRKEYDYSLNASDKPANAPNTDNNVKDNLSHQNVQNTVKTASNGKMFYKRVALILLTLDIISIIATFIISSTKITQANVPNQIPTLLIAIISNIVIPIIFVNFFTKEKKILKLFIEFFVFILIYNVLFCFQSFTFEWQLLYCVGMIIALSCFVILKIFFNINSVKKILDTINKYGDAFLVTGFRPESTYIIQSIVTGKSREVSLWGEAKVSSIIVINEVNEVLVSFKPQYSYYWFNIMYPSKIQHKIFGKII